MIVKKHIRWHHVLAAGLLLLSAGLLLSYVVPVGPPNARHAIAGFCVGMGAVLTIAAFVKSRAKQN